MRDSTIPCSPVASASALVSRRWAGDDPAARLLGFGSSWHAGTPGGAATAMGAAMLEQALEWIAQHRAAMIALVVVLALTLLAGRRW